MKKWIHSVWTPTVRKRALELLIAALTALIASLSTSCAIRWSSNSVEVEPRGAWTYASPAAAPSQNAGTNGSALDKR